MVCGARNVREISMPFPEAQNPFATALTEIELTVSAVDVLEVAGISTAGHLCQHTAAELLAIRGVTQAVLAELREKLAENGLRLRGE
jgi:DNA-directed RNA polymerase alpha subunit